MCGINGIFNFSNNQIGNQLSNINLMNEKIRHRGPDGNGTWYDHDHNIYLGHQRLSIIDLSDNARQPMKSNNNSILTYNGEIYNYKKIKSINNYNFNSSSDTEVLIALYDMYKEGCLEYLNGMFSFAIWDDNKKELFLARDRIGIKPLYYSIINSIFVFSSEIRSILSLPWIKPQLNKKELYNYLSFNFTTPPSTLFEGIYKFHPGHKMIVNKNGIIKYEKYWTEEIDVNTKYNEDDYLDLINREFKNSVELRMVSDVPVGAFISGGVDSSAVLANMVNHSNSTVNTFSVGFENSPEHNELDFSRELAELYRTNHHEIIVNENDFKNFIFEIANIFDDPLADPTSIPIYFLTKLANENKTKVVLTGDGPDELFIGYRRWMNLIRYKKYFDSLSSFPLDFLSKQLLGLNKFRTNSSLKEFLYRSSNNFEYFWGSIGGMKESSKEEILNKEFMNVIGESNSYEIIKSFKAEFENQNATNIIYWMSFLGLKHIIPNYYLYRADRLGMSNGVEIRVPFLDHNFVNLAINCPGEYKIKNNQPKYIIKKSYEKIIPKNFLYRKKMGFCVPIEKWGNNIMRNYIIYNFEQFCSETNLFDQRKISLMLKSNNSFMLWNVYFLINWHKKWFS